MQSKFLLIGVGVMVAVSLGVYVLTQNLNSNKEQASQDAGSPAANSSNDAVPLTESADGSVSQVNQVTIEGDEYKFIPASISLKKGEKTRVTFKNIGKAPHDLVIPELSVKTAVILGGQEVSFEVTPSMGGEYSFHCSVGNHQELGMEGEAKVE